jgi:hypothetical protein
MISTGITRDFRDTYVDRDDICHREECSQARSHFRGEPGVLDLILLYVTLVGRPVLRCLNDTYMSAALQTEDSSKRRPTDVDI